MPLNNPYHTTLGYVNFLVPDANKKKVGNHCFKRLLIRLQLKRHLVRESKLKISWYWNIGLKVESVKRFESCRKNYFISYFTFHSAKFSPQNKLKLQDCWCISCKWVVAAILRTVLQRCSLFFLHFSHLPRMSRVWTKLSAYRFNLLWSIFYSGPLHLHLFLSCRLHF